MSRTTADTTCLELEGSTLRYTIHSDRSVYATAVT